MGIFSRKPNIEKLKAKRDVEGLISALNYRRDHDVRIEAAIALGEIRDERAVEPLIEALKADWILVAKAAWALGEIGDVRAVEPLIPALEGELSTEATLPAKGALIKIGGAAVTGLIQALKNEDSNVRERAAEVLGEIGDKRAVEPLAEALQDWDPAVSGAAAEALEGIGEPAVESLFQALENPNTEWEALKVLRNMRARRELGKNDLRKLKKWANVLT